MFEALTIPLENRISIPGWYLPSFLLLGALTTLVPAEYSLLRIGISGPVLLYLLSQSPKYTAGNVNPDFVAGLFVAGITLKWWEFVIYRRSELEFWRVSAKGSTLPFGPVKPNENDHVHANGTARDHTNGHPEGQADRLTNGSAHSDIKRSFPTPDRVLPLVPGNFETFWEKVRWSVGLWTTTRGIEWNWGIKNLQKTSPKLLSRLSFVRWSAHRLIFALVTVDFARSIVGWTEWGDKAKVPHLSLFQEPFFRRMVVAWMVGFEIYGGLQIPYYFFATVTTALGICRPEQWPPIFGEFSKNAYRVRTWWGKCWHQQLRRSITTPAQAIVKALGLPKGDVTKYAELWLAFFFSSLVHSVSGYFIGRSTGGMFTIWMAQAAIITIEDYVIKYAQQYGIKDSKYTRGLGFIWTIAWMCWWPSLPTGAAISLHVGSGFDDPAEFNPSAWYPPTKSTDSLLKLCLDRGVIFFFLTRAMAIIEAHTWDDLVQAGQGIAGAAALYARSWHEEQQTNSVWTTDEIDGSQC